MYRRDYKLVCPGKRIRTGTSIALGSRTRTSIHSGMVVVRGIGARHAGLASVLVVVHLRRGQLARRRDKGESSVHAAAGGRRPWG